MTYTNKTESTEAVTAQEEGTGKRFSAYSVRIHELIRSIKSLLDAGTVSQADISRECGQGVSTGTISAFLRGKYLGDVEAVAEKLQRWLDARETKRKVDSLMPAAPGFVATPTGKSVLAVASYAHMAADIAVIYGGAGVGKTAALKHYAANNNNVWRVEMTAATGTLLACLDRICAALDCKRFIQRPAWLEDQIAKRVEGTGGLLIIDEAQHINKECLESIRGIHDRMEIGIVFSGNETIYSRLTGGGARSAEFAQLFSRVGKRLRLNKPAEQDVDVLAAAWKITGRAELEVMRAIAEKQGALRGLTKTLRMAVLLSEGKPLTAKAILESWQDLGGDA